MSEQSTAYYLRHKHENITMWTCLRHLAIPIAQCSPLIERNVLSLSMNKCQMLISLTHRNQKTWTEKSRMIRLLFISSTGPFTIDIYVCAFSVASVLSDSLWPHGLPPARFLCPWEFPSKNTELGCHALFQGIFLTQGSNACLLHCRQILYLLSHVGSPIDTCTLYIVKIIYLTLLILPDTSFIKL